MKQRVDPALAEQTRAVYERHAGAWDAHRRKMLLERAWLQRALEGVPAELGVLDVGCGAGDPIARFFIDAGRAVHGVDFSDPMLALCRARFPAQRWTLADMRTLELGETHGVVVGWDSFFHLTADEQRACLPRLAHHVAPGGTLLFTCGPEEGEVTGVVEGDAVYHASLSPQEYAALLEASGMRVEAFVPEDPDCDLHTVCLARRG
ncbi:MAG: class I SAM-dependent DNA methyltransferase [Nannocystaceae bacterium]|nr:class I SAM-dependent methyltransferase [bacterium]